VCFVKTIRIEDLTSAKTVELLAQAKIHVTKQPGDGNRTFCARGRRH
jgi:hypothetical protein